MKTRVVLQGAWTGAYDREGAGAHPLPPPPPVFRRFARVQYIYKHLCNHLRNFVAAFGPCYLFAGSTTCSL